VAGRKAADPGIVQKIAGFLGDNGYTQAWNSAVAAGLRPVDRMIASDEDLSRGLVKPLHGSMSGGDFDQHLTVLDPGEDRYQRFTDAIGPGLDEVQGEPGAFDDKMIAMIGQRYLRDEMGRAAMQRYDKAYGPSLPVSGPGLFAHAALANPVAAYGLPAAGVGMAAWGIHDLIAAQQQAEKESQLPLQGGVN